MSLKFVEVAGESNGVPPAFPDDLGDPKSEPYRTPSLIATLKTVMVDL